MSIAPIEPPASPIAEVTRPITSSPRANSTRRIRENWADGEDMGEGRDASRVGSRQRLRTDYICGVAGRRSRVAGPEPGPARPSEAVIGFPQCADIPTRARHPLPRPATCDPRPVNNLTPVADPDASRELFLIDGNSLAYRAFYALPETIATSRGFPTNAIFGFASMLVKILTEYGPKATLVVWDAGMSGRGDISEDYKAQRRPRPDLLQEQWPHLAPLVEAFGYQNVKVQGYEADDVISTLAVQARDKGIEVMIVTGDRNMFQMTAREGIRVMATSRGITETKIYDAQAVLDRYGIPPELIPDFYGLKGDTSDNIPGVPGIGDKTASDLLQRFGTLETVLDSIDEISGAKRKENLTNHAEDARMSKRLATAVTDVRAEELDIEHAVSNPPDRSRLRDVFREFELREPLRRIEEALAEQGEEGEVPRAEAAFTIAARAVEIPPQELNDLDGEL